MPLKGYKQPQEVVKRRADFLRGRKQKPRSEETRRRLSAALKGKFVGEKHPRWGVKLSDETKQKISASEKGKVIPPEVRQKMSLSRLGDKNPAWKGGVSFQKYTEDWHWVLKESIRVRDEYVCQECGIHQDELGEKWHKKLDVHHIDYNKKNCNPDNLISLCRTCHVKTNYNREYWIGYFNQKSNG